MADRQRTSDAAQAIYQASLVESDESLTTLVFLETHQLDHLELQMVVAHLAGMIASIKRDQA